MTPKKGHTMRIVRTALFAAALTSMSSVAYAQGKPAPKDVKLYFISPRDGQQIKGGFWARFGLRNMGVTHAGDEYQNSGQGQNCVSHMTSRPKRCLTLGARVLKKLLFRERR